jgi:GNAT superfamily N-acetyltransferase
MLEPESALWLFDPEPTETRMDVLIEPLVDMPLDELAAVVAESERAGMRFIRRLADEWAAGTNRFDKPGEALFAARADGRLVGVCGLNIDPYACDPQVGRVRRLYVLAEFRRLGVGRRLMEAVVAAARGRFASLRLRTESPEAAEFYERLGFHRRDGMPDCTHTLEFEPETAQVKEGPTAARSHLCSPTPAACRRR